MKLFIQIPCLNEEKTLPLVVADLPRKVEGIEKIYLLIIDDGSTDNTVKVATSLGVDYILKNGRNLGLAESYSRGLEACLSLGADIIVNTDGDNQYVGEDIPRLVKPIVEQQADMVVGCRDIDGHLEFARIKKYLQKIGSKVVSHISGTDVPDVTSGFRAVNRNAALNFSIFNKFSYTIDTLIQAGRTGMKVYTVPIRTNPSLRKSRLFKSIPVFIVQQLKIMFKVYLLYCPMRFFLGLASISFTVTVLNVLRISYFLFFAETGNFKFKEGSGVLLLFSAIVTVLFIVGGLLGSVLSGFRSLMLDMRSRIRKIEIQQNVSLPGSGIVTNSNFFEWARTKTKKEKIGVEKAYDK